MRNSTCFGYLFSHWNTVTECKYLLLKTTACKHKTARKPQILIYYHILHWDILLPRNFTVSSNKKQIKTQIIARPSLCHRIPSIKPEITSFLSQTKNLYDIQSIFCSNVKKNKLQTKKRCKTTAIEQGALSSKKTTYILLRIQKHKNTWYNNFLWEDSRKKSWKKTWNSYDN